MNDVGVGDVVQLDPEKASSRCFAGCLFIVDQVHPQRLRGYTAVPGDRDRPPGSAYLFFTRDEVVRIGEAEWRVSP